MTSSIIGKDVFKEAFTDIEERTVEDRKITVKRFEGISELKKKDSDEESKQHPQIEMIKKSHLLFICPSEKIYIPVILKSLKGQGVLTVADSEGFLEAGGIISLVMEENKVRFEINIDAAKQAEIQIRSQLLRLAKRIIKEETTSRFHNKVTFYCKTQGSLILSHLSD
jgi:hypothetical protein